MNKNYKNHENKKQMLEKKVKDIENSHGLLASNMYDILEKLKVL